MTFFSSFVLALKRSFARFWQPQTPDNLDSLADKHVATARAARQRPTFLWQSRDSPLFLLFSHSVLLHHTSSELILRANPAPSGTGMTRSCVSWYERRC